MSNADKRAVGLIPALELASLTLFLQLFLLHYFCLFSGLVLKAFLLFLLSKQGFCLSMSSCQLSLVKLIIRVREVSDRGRLEGHGGRFSS